MTTENSTIHDSQAGTNGVAVFMPSDFHDRATTIGKDARNDGIARGDTWDRASRPSSTSEPKLQLAGFTLAELEKLAIRQTLLKFSGNRTRAARKLGISVRTLQRKLRIWGRGSDSAADQPADKQDILARAHLEGSEQQELALEL